MINASQEFKNLINAGSKVVNYADITLKNGTVLNLTPEDFVLGGFSIDDEMTDGKFGVGYAIGKTINLTIANHTDKFSTYDFYKSIIFMYVAVQTEEGRVLKERKGKYYVINPTSPGEVIKLSGVDSMYLFDKPYDANTAYPATLQTVLSDCCLNCGVSIGFGQFNNYNFTVNNRPEDATYRDVVSYVAQIAGYNARISNNDALELIWYDTSYMGLDVLDGGKLLSYNESDIYDGGDFDDYAGDVLFDGGNFTDASPENVTKIKSLSVSTDEIVITGIVIENDNGKFVSGSEDYVIKIKDNPLTIGKEEEVLQILSNKLKGYNFRSLTCQITNNPLFEPFDACYIYDRKGNYYFTLINSVKYKIGGFTTISCKADDPMRNESSYTSEAAKAVVIARRNAEKQISTYDKAVQNMNLLAANAMGLYRESETQSDGSVIYYQSNRPITKNDSGKCQFETGSVVYKMTGNGFFVSTDGGESFTSGFDSNGNAIVNVLSAIGITFDWAKGGTLSLGGNNNVNGSLIVYDSSGNEAGRWDNEGIKLPENTVIKWNQINEASSYVTQITKNTVTTEYVNTLKIKAGSVDAEDITGTKISGKTIEGGSIKIGSLFSVDSNGNVIANSLKSNNAQITGGSINIETNSSTANSITLRYSTYTNSMSPIAIRLSGSDGTTELKSNGLTTSDIRAYYNDIDVSGTMNFNGATNFVIGKTHSVKGSFNCSGDATFSAYLRSSGNAIIGGSGKMVGFFGSSGGMKKTVNKIYSPSYAEASECATTINSLLDALKSYGLIL